MQLLATCWAQPVPSLAGEYEKQKSPWLIISIAQQQLKHQLVFRIIFMLNPKCISLQATRRKIHSIPDETKTLCEENKYKYLSVLSTKNNKK